MARKRASRKQIPTDAEPGSGFGGLADALRAEGLAATAAPSPTPSVSAPPPVADGLRGKAVVRQERKGRGGKTVTVIDGAAIRNHADTPALAKRMRKALGTGARVEGDRIVLQGDQREAAERWLTDQGAKVTLGN